MSRPVLSIEHTVICAALLLAGCAANESRIPTSAGHISGAAKSAAADDIPQPVQLSTQLPPPKPQIKPPTYSVVVTEVPVKELLFALARDTQLNIDVHPNIQGVVTLNAINETLPAILDRVANQVNIRYKLDGRTLIITPDTPYLKTYKVDYVNLSRKTTSSIGVSAQVATTGAAAGVGGAAGGQAGATSGNSSSTTVTSTSSNEFWEVLAANIRDLIKSTRSVSQSAEERNARVEAARTAREDRLQQANAVARAGQAAPNLFNAVFGQGAQNQLEEKKDDVIVNPAAGAVLVMDSRKDARAASAGAILVTRLMQRGVAGVHLGVEPANTRAIGFYRHLGFTAGAGEDGAVDQPFGVDGNRQNQIECLI